MHLQASITSAEKEQINVAEPVSMRDTYEMLTYLLVIIISMFVMAIWLKRRGRRKRK